MKEARRNASVAVADRLAARGLVEVEEYRPGRNFVRVGDAVRCRPPVGRSFPAMVRRILADDDGNVVEVEVYGGPAGRAMVRTFSPERIARRAQSRVETR